jgi:hypothetical protein
LSLPEMTTLTPTRSSMAYKPLPPSVLDYRYRSSDPS